MGKCLHPDQVEPVSAKEGGERGDGENAVVLVIDGVEFAVVHHVAHVGDLDLDPPLGGEDRRYAGNEPVLVGDMGEDVVAQDHVCPHSVRQHPMRQLGREEVPDRGDAPLFGSGCRTGRRVDSEDRHPGLEEPLEQVAVVAGQLHHQVVLAKAQLVDQSFGVGPRVLQDLVGEGGKVGIVLVEKHSGWHCLLDLDERAPRAEHHGERIVVLLRGGETWGHQFVGQGDHPEIEHGHQIGRPAAAAPANYIMHWYIMHRHIMHGRHPSSSSDGDRRPARRPPGATSRV